MDNQTLQSAIQEAVPSLNSIETKQLVEVAVSSENLPDALLILKNNAQLRFDFLVCQTGVDLNQQLGVFYHLRSTSLAHECVVKCMAPNRNEAQLPTSSHIWPAAIYFEREIFDLFGIRFTGHPNMKRIFLEDDFVGHPFRKDFEDPINIITKQ